MSGKGLSKSVIVSIVALVVIVAAAVALSMAPPAGGGGGGGEEIEEEASVVIDSGRNVGDNQVELALRNAGNVQVRVSLIIVKGTGIEGEAEYQDNTGFGVLMDPGDILQFALGLSEGVFESGKSYDLTFTLRTNGGDFEEQYIITAG